MHLHTYVCVYVLTEVYMCSMYVYACYVRMLPLGGIHRGNGTFAWDTKDKAPQIQWELAYLTG